MVGNRVLCRLRCFQTLTVILFVAVLTIGTHCTGCKENVTDRHQQPVVIPPHVPKNPTVRTGPHILPSDAVGIPPQEMKGARAPSQFQFLSR